MDGQKSLGFHKKYLDLYFEDYGFGATWGWEIAIILITILSQYDTFVEPFMTLLPKKKTL